MLEAKNLQQEIVIADLRKKTIEVTKVETKHSFPVVKEIGKADPEDDAKILEILKGMDEANAKNAKSKKSEANTNKRKAVMKTVVKEVEPVMEKADFDEIETAEAFFVNAIAEADKAKKMSEKEDVKEEIMNAISGVEASDDVVVKAETKAPAKKKRKTVKKKKSVRKVQKVEPVAVAPAEAQDDEGNPWGALKQSTLERKTIAQLTEYLQERVSTNSMIWK